jgi:uncharacterized protein YjbI with pentapeptide repeats
LSSANLQGVNLKESCLRDATLKEADLRGADFESSDARETDFADADLRNASFRYALVEHASLRGCRITGLATQGMTGELRDQTDLIITNPEEPEIVVDHLGLARFVELLLYHGSVRQVIDVVRAKSVLVLGRFGRERKEFLHMLRAALRERNNIPIVVDFDKPATRDLTETLMILASMSRFVVAELTGPSSVPKELQSIVPQLHSVPLIPLVRAPRRAFSMFDALARYPWVVAPRVYQKDEELLSTIDEAVIRPAEAKLAELAKS